jgi:hypothetical protein
MCGPLALPIAIVAGAGLAAGASVYSANKATKSQKEAMKSAEAQATKQAADDKAANERLINSANRKRSDFAGMLASNLMAGQGGVGSTMLTGPGGSTPNNSLLGRATLLGG